jgi:quercetin dioxygenase-like cupin family protein
VIRWLAPGLLLIAAGAAQAEESAGRLAAAVAAVPPAAAPAEVPGSPASVFAANAMHWTDTGSGGRTQLMDAPTRTLKQLEIHITRLDPGQTSHAPHRHPNEEVVVLREGELEVYVNGETTRIGPGSVMVFLSGDWHGVRNVGTGPAIYEVINFHP